MRVFIGCSASDAVPQKYKDLTVEISSMLARKGHKLVFGGSSKGMMGKAFFAFRYEEAKVKGVAIAEDADEVEAMELDRTEIVSTTFDRTRELFESSEVILMLPGGIGSLAEMFSMIDEVRSKRIEKPIIIFNFNSFYTPLLNYLTKLYENNFVSKMDLKMFEVVKDIKNLEKYIEKLESER